MCNTLEVWPLEFLHTQVGRFVSAVKLLGAAVSIPFGFEPWQQIFDLREVDAIGAGIGSSVGRKFNAGIRHDFGNYASDVDNPIIVLGLTYVKRLVAHDVVRCFQSGDERPRHVFDVDDGAQRRAIRLEIDKSFRRSPRNQIVENDVKSVARR